MSRANLTWGAPRIVGELGKIVGSRLRAVEAVRRGGAASARL
jgi:hypothetical protein